MKFITTILTSALLSYCGFADETVSMIEVPKETFDTFTNRVAVMWGYIHSTESNRVAFHGKRTDQEYDFDGDQPVLIITYDDGFKFEIDIKKGTLEPTSATATVKSINQTKPKTMSSAQWNAQTNNASKTVRILRSLTFGPGGKIIFSHDTVEK